MDFRKQNSLHRPLSEVELIYEDFDYSLEIKSFVRYMPPANDYDPNNHSATENIKNFFRSWQII